MNPFKTVEEVVRDTEFFECNIGYAYLLTQDREQIATALLTALEELHKIYDIDDKPHIPLDQAKAIVTNLLTPTV